MALVVASGAGNSTPEDLSVGLNGISNVRIMVYRRDLWSLDLDRWQRWPGEVCYVPIVVPSQLHTPMTWVNPFLGVRIG